jgi:hypothetical protein
MNPDCEWCANPRYPDLPPHLNQLMTHRINAGMNVPAVSRHFKVTKERVRKLEAVARTLLAED